MPQKEPPVAAPAPVTHTKAQLLRFKRYAGRRDLLSALLKDGKRYTTEQVDSLISDFMKPRKGRVK